MRSTDEWAREALNCVHDWKYSRRPIRQDDLSISETPTRECRKCHREELKWVPKYAKAYAHEYQPWEEAHD